MKIDKNFKFEVNITSDYYEDKQLATACLSSKGAAAVGKKKMSFKKEAVTVDEFIDRAVSGYGFCALYELDENKKYLYKNSKGLKYLAFPYYTSNKGTATKGGLKLDFKRDEYFSSSSIVFVDIDFTRYETLDAYISELELKPTMVYMSFSNGKEKNGIKSLRFRLCYVFEKPLGKDEFQEVASRVTLMVSNSTKEDVDDKCGERLSQYMNGCFGNNQNYKSYTIYSISDFDSYKKEIAALDNDIATKTVKKLKVEDLVFDEDILREWDIFDTKDFRLRPCWVRTLKYERHIYRIEREEWVGGKYQFVDKDYFRLFYNSSTVKDGQGRRKDIFMRMCLRRLIFPTVSAKTLVFNAIIDIIRQYDNSDKVLNSDYLRRNTAASLSLTIEEIKEKYKGELEYLRSLKPKKGIIYRNKEVKKKEVTYEILEDLYDFSLSVKENEEQLNEGYGYPIKKSTLYNFLKERVNNEAETKTLTNKELIAKTDLKLSANANYIRLKKLGYKLKKNRYFAVYKGLVTSK